MEETWYDWSNIDPSEMLDNAYGLVHSLSPESAPMVLSFKRLFERVSFRLQAMTQAERNGVWRSAAGGGGGRAEIWGEGVVGYCGERRDRPVAANNGDFSQASGGGAPPPSPCTRQFASVVCNEFYPVLGVNVSYILFRLALARDTSIDRV